MGTSVQAERNAGSRAAPRASLRARVLIAGGGLVGATTALALDRAGIGCTLVDGAELVPPSNGVSAVDNDTRPIALAEGTRRVFDTLGVWADMAGAATPIRTVHVSDRGGFGVTRIKAAEHGVEALGWVTPAAAIARALDAGLSSPSCSVERIVPGVASDADVKANGLDLEVQTPDGVSRTLTGELLVLADGGRSSLRARQGVRLSTRDYGQHAVVATVRCERPHECVAHERFTSEGPLALLPLRGQASDGRECALVWSLDDGVAGEVQTLPDDLFLARLRDRFGGRLGRFTAVGGRATFPLALEVANDTALARCIVLGGASQRLHPVAGQGFNLGVRDAAWLAQHLANAARAGEDLGNGALLARYRKARNADRRETRHLTDLLVRVFTNRLAPVRVARDIGLLALDLAPGLNRRFATRLMGLGGGFGGPASRLSLGLMP